MKALWIAAGLFSVGLLVTGVCGQAAGESEDKPVEKPAGGFRFTEGPAADVKGNVFFTDIPNNRIHVWSVEGKLSTFMEDTGGANGLFFDDAGNLIACAGGTGKLVLIDPATKETTVLADSYEGEPFNSPNDLWVDPNGGIYFSDPRYGSRDNLPQDGEHVYYLKSDRKTVIRVIDDMVRPNGLIGTPDGRQLYVADAGAGKTYLYTIRPDGTLTDKKLFVEQGSDGMTLDAEGNLYLTSDAVTVYDPSGKRIRTIEVPQRPSNVCFGGPEHKRLFITARTGFYSYQLPVISDRVGGFGIGRSSGGGPACRACRHSSGSVRWGRGFPRKL